VVIQKGSVVLLVLVMAGAFTGSLKGEAYTVGVGDLITISIIQPELSTTQTAVSPGGDISVPYLGSIMVRGKTLDQIQRIIQTRLSQGYLKYPVVTVTLVESRSRIFTITGEVIRPGNYQLVENTTVLKAISIAGGFTRYGSSSKVKVLRARKDRPGYDAIEVNIKNILNEKSDADIRLEPGDIVVVSESLF
jgi:polysaccharide biosynthesis/export protein